LFNSAASVPFAYKHVWRTGDLMLWDNRCSLHARTDFDPRERRLLCRVAILGEKPF
jgi:taurine dioxygenase